MEARLPCTDLVPELSKRECHAAECCWDEESFDVPLRCFQRGLPWCKNANINDNNQDLKTFDSELVRNLGEGLGREMYHTNACLPVLQQV